MQMPIQYKHTQFGTLTISVLIAGAVVLGIIGFVTGWHPVTSAVLVILLACVVLFYSLTAEIRNGYLEIRFGIGLIRKRFDLKEIEKAYPVRNHWYYGWGIRLIPHGWLFNVSGLDAVEIAISSGKRYRIGTDQPNELASAITGSRIYWRSGACPC
jgi:hypothetical protein